MPELPSPVAGGARRMFTLRRVALALLPVAGLSVFVALKLRPLPVVVTPVVRGQAVDAVYATGTVEAENRVRLKAKASGSIREIRVREGAAVKKGQLIALISPHVTVFDKQLRPAPPLLARYTGDFVAASVSHETPSDRQLRISRPAEIVSALERTPGVLGAASSLNGSAVLAFGSKQYPIDLRAIDPARQDRVTPISGYIKSGSYRALGGSQGILLGSGVASRVGAKTGDTVTVGSPLGQTLTLKVVGVFDAGIPPVDNSRVYVALRDGQAILGKPDVVGRVEIRLADTDQAVTVASQVEAMFGYDAESWQESNANFLALFAQQNTIISFVVGAILAVGGFGILAIQIMIVLQKTRDIAILRSVGFRRSDILFGFLLQGAIIALTGAAVGDVCGHWLVTFLGQLKTKQEGLVKSETFLVYDDPKFYWYGAAFALVVGLTASFIPAWRGSRVEPVDVLRGQLG